MNLLNLTKKFISLPSYVNKNINEIEIGNFVYSYLKKHEFFTVKKQLVKDGRFNVIATTKVKPNLLIAGHLDTVEPKDGWLVNQYKGICKDNALFGLGALDTKSGIATLLDSLDKYKDIKGLTLLFYCDEEYEFSGIRTFIKENKLKPANFALFIEPTDLKIWNSHRGLIEIYLAIKGVSGHAANPRSGRNAIMGVNRMLFLLEKEINNYLDPIQGESTMNIAYIRGGLYLGRRDEKIFVGQQGNNIADYAETIIEIRTASQSLNAEKLSQIIKKTLIPSFTILDLKINHDFNPLITTKEQLKFIENIIEKIIGKAEYLDPKNRGYSDGQLIQNKYKIPVIYLGPKGGNAHAPNEWVDIPSLFVLKKIYSLIMEKYCVSENK